MNLIGPCKHVKLLYAIITTATTWLSVLRIRALKARLPFVSVDCTEHACCGHGWDQFVSTPRNVRSNVPTRSHRTDSQLRLCRGIILTGQIRACFNPRPGAGRHMLHSLTYWPSILRSFYTKHLYMTKAQLHLTVPFNGPLLGPLQPHCTTFPCLLLITAIKPTKR